MRKSLVFAAGAFLALVSDAKAVEISFDGYADLRLVVPGSERGWLDGGLGKLRFGGDQPSPDFRFAEAVGQVTLALADDLHAVSVVRLEPEQRSGIDVLETYASWRPAADGDWRWSVKAGAFFPPISVENDDLGWTSPYTLTPSAINSWVGEELRTIGGEATVARATPAGTLSLVGALFCCNEPAGTLIADRGWALDDRPTGLFERVRLPDATVALFGGTPPERTGLFQQFDGHVGWYAALRWDVSALGQLAVLRYDNEADPGAHSARDSAWATRFWAASLKTRLLGFAILAQGLSGSTTIEDGGGGYHTTDFDSAFALASYDIGDWRISGRAETFATRNGGGAFLSEDGHAFTGAMIWSATDWLRLSAELLSLSSRRPERVLEASAPERDETQFQLGARLFF